MRSEERTVQKKDGKTKNRRLLTLILILLLIVVIGAVYLYLMSPGQWKMNMKVKGGTEVSLVQGEDYVEEGCTAKCENRITGVVRDVKVNIKGDVNTDEIGTYTVSYTAEYLGKQKTVKKTVTVEKNIQLGRKISVYDTFGSDKGPVIGLYGGSKMTVYDAFGFKDGFVATDSNGAYITDKVKVSGQVDPSTPGEQTITYSVTGSNGKKVEAKRTVTVEKYEENPFPEINDGEKIIYLTFDDGPAQYTSKLLSILDKYDVKVTFFVTAVGGESYYHLIKEEAEKGHAVGVHSYTHDYKKIYSSDQAFWDDFYKMSDLIKEQTGKDPDISRFPGGGSNTVSKKYNQGIVTRLANEVTAKGYSYYDWNVMSGDAGNTKDTNKVLENIKNGVMKNDCSIVLCHDTHDYTVNAIEPFIKWAQENGYRFETLKNGDFGTHQALLN